MGLTLFLIIATSAVSITAFNNKGLFDKLKFNAYMIVRKNEKGRIFAHGLLHADWGHLIVNMFVLYMFGEIVEQYFTEIMPKFGKLLYIAMYVLAIPVSTIPALIKHKNHTYYNSVGASGAVSAILFASILLDPTTSVMFIFIPIPIPSPIFGVLYLGYSYYMSKKNADNIAHDAHFAGSVFGFIFPIIIQPYLIFRFFEMIF